MDRAVGRGHSVKILDSSAFVKSLDTPSHKKARRSEPTLIKPWGSYPQTADNHRQGYPAWSDVVKRSLMPWTRLLKKSPGATRANA